jgi:hypothetical protein
MLGSSKMVRYFALFVKGGSGNEPQKTRVSRADED